MLREFGEWWAGQMLDLVPERIREAVVAEVDALLIEPEGDIAAPSTIALTLLRHGRTSRLGRFPLDAAGLQGARRAGQVPGQTSATWLRLPRHLLLDKRLTLPLAAERDIERVLSYEMDHETPFTADEVWWSYTVDQRDRAQGKVALTLSLIPKPSVAGLIAALEQAGLAPTALEIPLDDSGMRRLPLSAHAARTGIWRMQALPTAAAACALLAVIACGLPFLRQHLAYHAASEQLAALKPAVDEAEKLRLQLQGGGGANVVESERARFGDPLAVLAAATRLLPDDTFLSDFTMQQRKLALNGQSVSPAKLIGALAEDPTFKDPAFAAPSTRAEGAHADVFSISAEARP